MTAHENTTLYLESLLSKNNIFNTNEKLKTPSDAITARNALLLFWDNLGPNSWSWSKYLPANNIEASTRRREWAKVSHIWYQWKDGNIDSSLLKTYIRYPKKPSGLRMRHGSRSWHFGKFTYLTTIITMPPNWPCKNQIRCHASPWDLRHDH